MTFAIKEALIGQFKFWDYGKGHKGKGHERGLKGGAEMPGQGIQFAVPLGNAETVLI